MNHLNLPSSPWTRRLCCLVLLWPLSARPANLPAEWRYEQPFNVVAAGLVKLSLPPQTLDRARPGLEDLRLYDDAGRELPYVIERPRPAAKTIQPAKIFEVNLNPGNTVITIETGLSKPLDAVSLETPADSFIKSVQIAGSNDGKNWQPLAQGQPIFRQPGGAARLRLPVPVGIWQRLRLTVDDQRSQPIPFTGARIEAASGESAPSEEMPLDIVERDENPGETRLTLNLGTAHLDLAGVELETTDPLFTRRVSVAAPSFTEGSLREELLAEGTVYRVALPGEPASSNLVVSLERQVRARELVLLIRNQDSPPLSIKAIRAQRRPVYLVFMAPQAGAFHLLTGNNRCGAPSYDLVALDAHLKAAAVQPISLPAPADNPNYRTPEVLPGIESDGAPLDVSAWRFRKAIEPAGGGVRQIELDLEVLSRAAPGFEDLRLLSGGKQVPYILEHTSISRPLAPGVIATNDAKDHGLSRWLLKLPHNALPVTRLTCGSQTRLFQREVSLWEEAGGERGESYRRSLGAASWLQTPERAVKTFFLTIDARPEGNTLLLETHNGDNPPLQLEHFQVFYPATRILFKAGAGQELYLYYGNPEASAPRYDLSLVAGQLLAAEKTPASLDAENQIKQSGWGERQTLGKGGIVFWGILALVVAVLLAVISRLLPKSAEIPK